MKLTLVIVTLLLIVGCMGFEDEQGLEANYCEMVNSGAWPHYNKSIDCEG